MFMNIIFVLFDWATHIYYVGHQNSRNVLLWSKGQKVSNVFWIAPSTNPTNVEHKNMTEEWWKKTQINSYYLFIYSLSTTGPTNSAQSKGWCDRQQRWFSTAECASKSSRQLYVCSIECGRRWRKQLGRAESYVWVDKQHYWEFFFLFFVVQWCSGVYAVLLVLQVVEMKMHILEGVEVDTTWMVVDGSWTDRVRVLMFVICKGNCKFEIRYSNNCLTYNFEFRIYDSVFEFE